MSIGAFSVGTGVIQFEAGGEFRSYKHKGYNNSKVNGMVGFFSLRWGFLKEQLELTYEGSYLLDKITNKLIDPNFSYKRNDFFGNFIGDRIGSISNFDYIDYIIPGLVIMPIISNSYMNVVGSFYSSRFQKSHEEMMVSPVPDYIILLGYVSGGVMRAFVVGIAVFLVTTFFTDIPIYNLSLIHI